MGDPLPKALWWSRCALSRRDQECSWDIYTFQLFTQDEEYNTVDAEERQSTAQRRNERANGNALILLTGTAALIDGVRERCGCGGLSR